MTLARPLLLVVDDEQDVLSLVRRVAEEEAFEAVVCSNGHQAIQIAHDRRPDLVIVDLRMPDVSGVEIVRALRAADAKASIVLMTMHASSESAVKAVKLGAADYLTKPLDLQRLKDTFGKVKEEAERRVRIMTLDREVAERAGFAGMVGRSPAMQEIFDIIRRLAPHAPTALISGEAGTGKELAARALHHAGPRRPRRFVVVKCSGSSEALLESQLFGHAPGAFNGARDAKAGLLEVADGSTLFLDEIGDLPLSLQTKLLRVIETGEVTRVGALQPVTVDVRIVCATSCDLAAEAAVGAFRSDLLRRLNVVPIALPPLRDRREDIPYITATFVREFGERFRKPIAGVTMAAERLLNEAPWPGNVRQLRTVIERACMVADGAILTEEGIRASIRPTIRVPRVTGDRRPAGEPARALSSLERQHIMKVIAETGGNKARAARQLGLSRRALYRRLERHGLNAGPARRES
jgi:DNA-binding NtrC family response regulator